MADQMPERQWEEWNPEWALPFGLQTGTGKLSMSSRAFVMR